MKKDEAFQPFLNLETQVKKIANDLKLDLGKFNITLGDDGHHMIQVAFIMRPEAIMNDGELEQKGYDDEFSRMARVMQSEQRNDERAQKASAEISEWLKGSDDDVQSP